MTVNMLSIYGSPCFMNVILRDFSVMGIHAKKRNKGNLFILWIPVCKRTL
jgi:hypothetical protein